MQNPDGSFLAYYDAETQTKHHRWDEFHGDDGCLHIKNALGLLSLAQITDGERYFGAARRVCDWGTCLQRADGLFWANPRKKYVLTHAHCYATEGYLYAYHILGESAYLDACVASGDALLALQNKDGSLYHAYDNRLSFKSRIRGNLLPHKTVDATAQAVRIWLILRSIANDEGYRRAAEKGVSFLESMQETALRDSNATGGFHYQCCEAIPFRRLTATMFTWCTQFSIAALHAFCHMGSNGIHDTMVEQLF